MKQIQSEHKYKSPVWNEERKQWLIDNTKGLGGQEAYEKFCAAFPEVQTTFVAVTNQRSRLRCASYTCSHPSTKLRPLYSEHEKKGYVFVKVAMPSVWWSKAKFVYIATHPEEAGTFLDTDSFYFADGNNRNFDWKNILRVHRSEQTIFVHFGGVVPGQPEVTRLHLIQARLRIAQFDAAQKIGDVVTTKGFRVIRSERNARACAYHKRKYKNDPEFRAKLREYHKKQRESLTPEQKERLKKRQREWARQKRLKMKEAELATNKSM